MRHHEFQPYLRMRASRYDVSRRLGAIMGGTSMKLHGVKECLDVHNSDISGSTYDDVNMSGSTVGNVNLAGCSFKDVNMSGAVFDDCNLSGWKIHNVNLGGLKIAKANLAGAAIMQGRMEGMTIDGILVSDLLAAYRAGKPAEQSK
jgi:uncharacterized protein YjbI with pentapeptide repeats